jgi:uncharacterized protein YciI
MTAYYAIVGEDVPASLDQRLAARPAHLERLERLRDEGRLRQPGGGPRLGGGGPLRGGGRL